MKTELERSDDQIKELFEKLETFANVADLFEVPVHVFKYLLYKQEYTEIKITKRKGGVRTLHAPSNSLKILQRKFLKILNLRFPNQKHCVHSFTKEKGIRTNAENHLRKRTILTVDLKDFYPSISYARVYGLFRKAPFNFNNMVAATLANLCCHKNQLPQGAPTSPFISNLISRKLDNSLLKMARDHRISYSRYADDLTFSTSQKELPVVITSELSSEPVAGSKTLAAEIKDNGFVLNPEKTRFMRAGQRQMVTGVVVNNKKMHIRRETVRSIRAVLHSWSQNGYEHAKQEYINKYKNHLSRKTTPSEELGLVLKGKIDHIGYVRGKDDPLYLKFLFHLNTLEPNFLSEKEYNKKLKPFENRDSKIKKSLWLLETEFGDDSSQGTAFAFEAIEGLITCNHCLPSGHFFYVRQPHVGHTQKILVEKIWHDESLDVAILARPQGRDLYPLNCGQSKSLQQMSDLIICGFPNFGSDSHSLISAKVMARRTYFEESTILLDRGIVSGNSGGPVTDLNGRVIGIAQRGARSRSGQYSTEHHGVMPIERIIGAIQYNNPSILNSNFRN